MTAVDGDSRAVMILTRAALGNVATDLKDAGMTSEAVERGIVAGALASIGDHCRDNGWMALGACLGAAMRYAHEANGGCSPEIAAESVRTALDKLQAILEASA